MKALNKTNNVQILTAGRGEELIKTLTEYCLKENIQSAHISAIGACEQVTLSWYDLSSKKYEDHEYSEGMEITGLMGNIALLNGTPIIHAHGTFARRDMTVIGGHIKKMTVSATCEIRLETGSRTLSRSFDEKTGLNLINGDTAG